jgi:hypothetical protein
MLSQWIMSISSLSLSSPLPHNLVTFWVMYCSCTFVRARSHLYTLRRYMFYLFALFCCLSVSQESHHCRPAEKILPVCLCLCAPRTQPTEKVFLRELRPLINSWKHFKKTNRMFGMPKSVSTKLFLFIFSCHRFGVFVLFGPVYWQSRGGSDAMPLNLV